MFPLLLRVNQWATGFLRQNVNGGTSLKITDVKGEFHIGEQIKFDGVDETQIYC